VRLDVLSMGRAGVDLYAEQVGVPLERVTSFAKYMGGCAGNIAVGAARLGLRVGMLTRVGDDALGRFIHGFLASEGVNVQGVRSDPAHLSGLAILGIEPPDRFPLIFYRERCADIHLTAADVTASAVRETRALVVTGTGFSREPSRQATQLAIRLAREAGAQVVLDVDVRPMLWDGGAEEMAGQMPPVLAAADVIVGTEEELALVTRQASAEEAVSALRAQVSGLIVIKRGGRGATAVEASGKTTSVPAFRVEVLNTLGSGDGFMAGFLKGWLGAQSLAETLRMGNAVGGIVASRHACAPAMPTPAEVDELMRRAELVA
jgi:5-dehydro-2-deoxygluconokinase